MPRYIIIAESLWSVAPAKHLCYSLIPIWDVEKVTERAFETEKDAIHFRDKICAKFEFSHESFQIVDLDEI